MNRKERRSAAAKVRKGELDRNVSEAERRLIRSGHLEAPRAAGSGPRFAEDVEDVFVPVVRSAPRKVVATQDNQLVTACYRMTLTEKRLLLLGISKVDSSKMPSRGAPLEFDITVAEWRSHFGDDSRSVYKDLDAASKRLMRRQVFLRGRQTGDQLVQWVDRCQYHPGEARISIRFGWTISHYLGGLLEQFTKVDLLSIRALNSFHSIRLYELLVQFRSTGYRIISLDELRDVLELGPAYSRFADLKRRIIDSAVSEINLKTDLVLSWQEVKEDRRVVSLRFFFEEQRQTSLPL